MRSRRPLLILLVAGILLLGALGAAQRDRERPASSAPASSSSPAGGEVTATLPSERRVEANVGDTVVLRVRSSSPDIARIIAAGAQAPVGPELPGELRFVAGAPGELEVVLELAGTRVGLVEVS